MGATGGVRASYRFDRGKEVHILQGKDGSVTPNKGVGQVLYPNVKGEDNGLLRHHRIDMKRIDVAHLSVR
jgi:hypothetical protein